MLSHLAFPAVSFASGPALAENKTRRGQHDQVWFRVCCDGAFLLIADTRPQAFRIAAPIAPGSVTILAACRANTDPQAGLAQ